MNHDEKPFIGFSDVSEPTDSNTALSVVLFHCEHNRSVFRGVTVSIVSISLAYRDFMFCIMIKQTVQTVFDGNVSCDKIMSRPKVEFF